MLNSETYKDLIDSHFKGTLNPEQSSSLQEALKSNPSLKNEFELQASIIATLQTNRKAELKARLNNVEVGGLQTQWWKYAAVLGLIATVSTWVYLNKITRDEVANTPQIILSPVQQNQRATNTVAIAKSTTTKEPIQTTVDNPVRAVTPTHSPTIHTNSEQKSTRTRVEKENIQLLPESHSPEIAHQDHSFDKAVETPTFDLGKTPQLSASVAGVEVVKSKKHKFHYQYFDNKLFLYGDFDSKTYEILELNTSKGQKLYLRFESNYYGLEPNKTEISKLEIVKKRETLRELEEIQKK